MTLRSSLVAAGALIALGATGATGASAQDLLSVEEMKGCLLQQQRLDEQKADIDRRSASLEEARATLQAVRQDIAERQMFMTSDNGRLRSEYKTLLAQERSMADINAENLEAHNQHVAAYNDAREYYMTTCGNRTYNDAVLNQAKREMGLLP